ncbi:MAG: tetratricopeptide repeat protein [Gammaproteobacteria bacterium]|nr:tetratricopeptide repeat protein [Gammaproteobacteria bacterium]
MKKILFLCLCVSGAVALPHVVLATDANRGYQADTILDGDYAAAEARLRDHLAAHPDDSFALLNLAAICDRSGRSGEAREIYQRVMALRDNPYAKLADRRVEPVKTIAGNALEALDKRP